jgi:hypothetical protein
MYAGSLGAHMGPGCRTSTGLLAHGCVPASAVDQHNTGRGAESSAGAVLVLFDAYWWVLDMAAVQCMTKACTSWS